MTPKGLSEPVCDRVVEKEQILEFSGFPNVTKPQKNKWFLHDFTYAPGAPYGSKMTSKMVPPGSLGGLFSDKCTQKGLPKKLLKF